jgi:hypothetical protein
MMRLETGEGSHLFDVMFKVRTRPTDGREHGRATLLKYRLTDTAVMLACAPRLEIVRIATGTPTVFVIKPITIIMSIDTTIAASCVATIFLPE